MSRVCTTACPNDCPDGCVMRAECVAGEVSLRPHEAHPWTSFLCAKGTTWIERTLGDDRLTAPLLRDGAGWRELSWRSAWRLWADKAKETLDRFGPLSMMHYHHAGSLYFSKALLPSVFAALGGCTRTVGSLCGSAGNRGLRNCFGEVPVQRPETTQRFAGGILFWGRNALETHPHVVPLLREIRRRGGEIASVEIRKSATAAFGDRFWRVRPGGDAFLAAFLCRRLVLEGRCSPAWRARARNSAAFAAFLDSLDEAMLLENAGMPREEAVELLAWLCRFFPVTHYGGYGMQRYLSGHLQFWWIGALAVLLGAFESPGGGVVFGKDESALFPKEFLPLFPLERRLPIAAWFRELPRCSPSVTLLVVTCANPLRQSPQSDSLARALRNIPFKVCVDHVLTETAAACDLVLPAATFLEEGDDWRGSYWHNYLVRSEQVFSPRGQVLPDVKIFSGFAEALGLSVDLEERKRLMDARLLADTRLECVGEGLYRWDEPEFWRLEDSCASLPLELPQSGDDGTTLSREGVTSSPMPYIVSETEGLRHVPLRLVTVHVAAYTNGQSRHVRGLPDLPECRMAPDEARERGFAEGECLLLQGENGEGKMEVHLVVDSSLGRGYVILPQGLPGVNSLTKALVSPGYGAPYAESRVLVTRSKGAPARA